MSIRMTRLDYEINTCGYVPLVIRATIYAARNDDGNWDIHQVCLNELVLWFFHDQGEEFDLPLREITVTQFIKHRWFPDHRAELCEALNAAEAAETAAGVCREVH